jgi:polyisoprenoid-binding protein YceI
VRFNESVVLERVGFAVKHMVATVTGEFAKFSGFVDIDEDDPTTGRMETTIDAASIDTRVVDRDVKSQGAHHG